MTTTVIGDTSYYLGSEDLCELTCIPCQNMGQLENAVGMCTDCQEYLCQSCYIAHNIPTLMRHHELLGKEQMMESTTSLKRNDKCTERCNVHNDKVLRYFCINHFQFGCSVCITLNHRSCDKVSYIPDLAKDLDNNEEFRQTENMLKSIITRYNMVIENAKKQTKSLHNNCLNAIETIQEFRREINKNFDKLETDLVEKAESLKSEEIKKVENQMDVFKFEHIDLQSTLDELQRLKNNGQNCNLYTLMMKTKNRLKTLENEIHASEIEQSLINSKIQFMANKEILNTLRNPNILGVISGSNAQVESNEAENQTLTAIKHIKDINVESETDIVGCWITGLVCLSDSTLLIADRNNKTLKMVDIRENIIFSSLALSSGPWDVTMIDDNQVAVTLPEEKSIAIVSVAAPTMSLDRVFSGRGVCRGLSFRDGKLAVALFDQNKIVVLDLQGSVLQTIATDKKGQSIIEDPYYVTFGKDSTTLYVSNNAFNNVVCVKCDKTLVATITDETLIGPQGLIVDKDGNVYVCGKDSHQIHKFTPEGDPFETVMAGVDGLTEPYSISYNEATHTCFVGMWNSFNRNNYSHSIKMFRVVMCQLIVILGDRVAKVST